MKIKNIEMDINVDVKNVYRYSISIDENYISSGALVRRCKRKAVANLTAILLSYR